jgi:hypothetical protein
VFSVASATATVAVRLPKLCAFAPIAQKDDVEDSNAVAISK